MAILLILYNTGLFLLFTTVTTLAFIAYLRSSKAFYLTVSLLFIFLIINNILIFLTEQVPWFSDAFDQMFLTTPSPKTILLVAHSIFLVLILDAALQSKLQFWQYTLVIGQVLFLLFIPMLPNNAIKVWFFYFSSDVVNIILAIYSLSVLKVISQTKPDLLAKHIKVQIDNLNLFKNISRFTLIMALFVALEDTIVIFFVDNYTVGSVHMTNRNLSEDILAITYAIIGIIYFSKTLMMTELPNEVANKKDFKSKRLKFSYDYNITSRELEVLSLLLMNKSNQEISNALFISTGTVKCHIHNIFTKLEVTKRYQVQQLYESYDASIDPE